MFSDHPRTHFSGVFGAIECAVLVLFTVPALAQPAAGISPSSSELTPAERAQRDGDKVFKWILIHSDKPRKAASPSKDEKAASVPRAKLAPRAAKAEDTAEPTSAAATPAVVAPERESTPQVAAAPESAAPSDTVDAAPAKEAEAAVPKQSADQVVATAPPREPPPAPPVLPEELPDEILKPIFQVDPKLPRNLMEMNRGDHVEVRFTVLPDGSVADPTMVTASNRRLVSYALAAIAQWRFAPLRKRQMGSVDLVFNLQ